MRNDSRKFVGLSLVLALAVSVCLSSTAQQSVKETMDNVVTRLYAELDQKALGSLTDDAVLKLLTAEEQEILATKYWYFDVNVPVVVSIMRADSQPVVPFWLEPSGFTKTDMVVKDVEDWGYEVWQKKFDAGRVELGINGFDKERKVYFVCVGPQEPGAKVEISNLFPADEAVIEMKDGAWKYRDWDDLFIKDVPESLTGQILLTTYRGRARDAHLVGAFRTTPFPSSSTPDQITLTWSDDPRITQAVQWRTSTGHRDAAVLYRKKGSETFLAIAAECEVIQDRLLVNDRYIHHYTGVMKGLKPATTYEYQVGSPAKKTWSDVYEFTTAPLEPAPFSFMCFADTHYSKPWGELLQAAFKEHPDTAFYMIAGDVVSTGLDRNEWDHNLDYARGIGERKPMAFALGNHDDQDGLGAWLPLALYAFPEDGPAGEEPEETFSFRYGNALFLFCGVGASHEVQARWMEEQLANTDATWKFVVFHFPIYSVEEDYTAIRKSWSKVFDKHHVDMAFHGHVHYYLRTKPMNNLKPVASPADGTIYTISIAQSGRKYPQPKADWVEERFTGTACYPKVDIDGNRMTYRAYDIDGKVLDELVIEK
ncbi:MAG: metallophosphoesterase [bacterium]|nr:metallophosphoesterase [bacterium]